MSTPSGSRPTSRNYDTGFPDAFAEYTTSRRHPEANVSPGACISAEDIDSSRTLQRTRRSFLAKHKRTISHGVITQDSHRQQTNHSTLVLPSVDSAVDVGDVKPVDTNGSIGRSSKDGTESIDRIEFSINGDYSPPSPNVPYEEDLSDDGRHKMKLFRKWRSHKD
ncbi:hypothetical protein F4677DRAFT_198743 [Hypoxylon crocopeplum]|nr:hypothetical protein F4677DRAFT_198743 [Hypoxylon crocopeplum]